MADILVISVVAGLFFAAVAYIRKEKKRGVACIGCPHAGQCAKRRQGGCSTDVK